jgi:hypothetical protein
MKLTTEVHRRHNNVLLIINDEESDSPNKAIGSIDLGDSDERMVELWQKGLEAINQSLQQTV